MRHTEDDLLRDEARAKAHKRPKMPPTPDPYEHLAPETLRDELKYLAKKRRFIANGQYLPMTTFNYRRAANLSYRVIDAIDKVNNTMRLACGDWNPVVPQNPPVMGELRFCGRCADAKYRQIMLEEIRDSEKRVRKALGARKPWWLRILTLGVVIVVASGLLLQAASILRPHRVGNFDPRSDDNAEGQCP